MVVVADVAYGIDPPPGGLFPALLAVVIASLCFACCGFAVASLVDSPDGAQPVLQVVLLPLQMISGIYFPMSQLPDWLQHVANAFPLAHLTSALQHAWLPTRRADRLGRPGDPGALGRGDGRARRAALPLAAHPVNSGAPATVRPPVHRRHPEIARTRPPAPPGGA